ncbi:TlpA disulfide reductase family protein [Seonamhaeicola sp.]|uniref:TlpA family protein disulfide reductase n=1 Tax=Seonamhaeicola sp. TaxID=1912245 RepID=UPI00260333F4|nr:TlpA disulfide reductase family protein [Seonamhaeicola sp.]
MRRIIILIISLNVLGCSQSQNINPQEQKDWAYFQANKSRLCETTEQCNALDNSNLLEYSKLIDAVYTKRSKMAEDFMDKYPKSEHYNEMLNHFLSVYFEPKFLTKDMDDKQIEFLSQFIGPVRYGPKVSSFYRALQIDGEAVQQWVKKGNRLVNQVLESNATMERKAEVEVRLLNRDFHIAKRWYDALPKIDRENDYWSHFDRQYWNFIKQRLVGLLEKYPDYEPLGGYIFSLVDDTLRIRSAKLSEEYIRFFLEYSGEQNPLSNRKGVRAVYDRLNDYLEAVKDLEQEDASEHFDAELIGLDGTKLNLSQLRGKVVLVDFWSTWCAPCIKEMPHVAALYKKYREHGFEVVGIVSGGNKVKESVRKITQRQGATWLQHMDMGNNSKVSYHALYKVHSLPTVWLLDKDGKVVDKKARGERLEPLIKKYLGL